MYTQAELKALEDKDYRDSYVDSHVKSSVAYQLQCIRDNLGLTQKDFSLLVGKPQSVISRLENTEYGKVTVQTLLDLAHRLDISLIVRFASFPEFLQNYSDVSPERLAVDSYAASEAKAVLPMSLAVPTLPTSGTPSERQIASTETAFLGYGESRHCVANIVSERGIMLISGIAITPFIGLQPVPASGGNLQPVPASGGN